MLHGVASTLSQDFTKSSSNQEMNIESRGVSSAAFGVAKAKVSQSKVIAKEESSLGQTKKSATITTKQTSKHQEAFGTGRFQSSAGGMEESAAEGNEFKRKGQMTMSSKKTEGQYGEERLGGQGAKVKKEVIRHGEGWDTKTITSKGTISETGHHLNFNATAYDNLTLDDSSKRAKVVKTKRLVTKTINTGNGLNTSGPHLK